MTNADVEARHDVTVAVVLVCMADASSDHPDEAGRC
jgi:hypothetical protein